MTSTHSFSPPTDMPAAPDVPTHVPAHVLNIHERLLAARRLPGLPVLSASLECGELDWTKAREILRVVTPDTEVAWVERAASVTSRVLEAEVATSLVGELPST